MSLSDECDGPGAKAVGLTPVFATGMMPELTKQEILEREASASHKIEKLEELLSLST